MSSEHTDEHHHNLLSKTPHSILLVIATMQEAKALAPLPECFRLVVSGVGPVAAALATQKALGRPSNAPRNAPSSADHTNRSDHSGHSSVQLIMSVGIAGAYPQRGVRVGDLVLSSQLIQADLGAWDGPHLIDLATLGFSIHPQHQQGAIFSAWHGAKTLAQQLDAAYGLMLTTNAATGQQTQLERIQQQFPTALSEGMEGSGVAQAAFLAEVPMLELRGISNMVGPRDRDSWQIAQALRHLRLALLAIAQRQLL